MYIKLIFLLFANCFLANNAFGQTGRLLHSSFADREKIMDSLFHTRSIIDKEIADSSFFYTSINRLLKFAKRENDQELYEHLLLEQFRYRLKTTDSITLTPEDLNAFINDFHTNDKKYFVVCAQHAYANRLSELKHDLERAFELYVSSFYAYEQFTKDEFPFKASFLYDIALAYYRFEDYANTIKYSSLALREADTCYCRSFDMINTLGLSYRETGQYDSALYFFNKILENDKQDWQYIAKLNIGHTYLYQKQYTPAKEVFTDCYHTGQKKGINHMISEAALVLGRIAFIEKEYNVAESYTKTAIDLWRKKFGGQWHYERMLTAQIAYELLADIYQQKGDYKTAYFCRDTFLLMKDSISNSYNALKLSNAQNNVLLARYEQEIERVKYERKSNRLVRNGLLLFIFFATVITLLFIKNQRLKRKKLEADKQNAENKLQDFKKALLQKTQLIDAATRELEQYKARKNETDYTETLYKLQQSTILTDEEWIDFRNMFEQVHQGFLHRLKMKLPDLTPAETRFMVLSKLKFSPKDMANILGVGSSAIRKYRYRLRNKLNLPEDGSIDEVVDMI